MYIFLKKAREKRRVRTRKNVRIKVLVSRSAEQGDGRAEELLLKMHLFTNLLNGKSYPFRGNDPLILNIIFSLDNCDYFADKFTDRHVYAENIGILLLSIGSDDTLDVAVIYRITELGEIGVKAAERTVNDDPNNRIGHKKSLLTIAFCGADRGNKQHTQRGAVIIEPFELSIAEVTGFEEQLEPITGFVCFLESNLKLSNKIGSAMSVLSLTNVGADGGAAPANLIRYYGFALSFSIFTRLMMATAKSIDKVESLSFLIVAVPYFGSDCKSRSQKKRVT